MSKNVTRSGGFAMQPTNMEEAMRLAQMISQSEIVPKCYKGKSGDTLVAMMLGTELGLNPIQSLQNIAVINGRPSIYGDALLALMQNHPAFGGIEESFDEQTMTATCTVWRKGGHKHTQTFSKADAESAGLWGKAGPWTQYKKRMLQMRARGFAVRDQFSDALAGLITREEAEDMPQGEVDVTPRPAARPAIEHYPDSDFETNFPKWQQAIQSGKVTHNQLISMISSKADLSEDQKKSILALEGPAKTEGEAA